MPTPELDLIRSGPSCVIPLTRGKSALVDSADYPTLVQFKWNAIKGTHTWYARRHLGNYKFQLMHRFIVGAPDNQDVDHINRNGLDNRRSNLRLANDRQNAGNRKQRANAGPYKGVRWGARAGTRPALPWVASLANKHLGSFPTARDAALAYDAAARGYYGEFARLNFPREGEQGV